VHESAWARPAWPGRTAQGAGHRPSWPCRMCRRVAESARQTYMDRSSPADAMCIPSGENATEVTFEVCPRKVCSGCPLHASHSLQELSLPPETMRSPFEEKASERISPWCALSPSRSVPDPKPPLHVAAGKLRGIDTERGTCQT
jgi:hypothetical protein